MRRIAAYSVGTVYVLIRGPWLSLEYSVCLSDLIITKTLVYLSSEALGYHWSIQSVCPTNNYKDTCLFIIRGPWLSLEYSVCLSDLIITKTLVYLSSEALGYHWSIQSVCPTNNYKDTCLFIIRGPWLSLEYSVCLSD